MREITLKTSGDNILKSFRECTPTQQVNLKTEKGHIFEAGGILSKLVGRTQYFAINGRWVKA